jgi:TRAP-type C4-dicarboxylate transport system permease small subunit
MGKFERIIHLLSEWCDRVSRVALILMTFIVVLNILSRIVWQSLPGTYEIAGYLGAVVLGFALAWCGVKDRYVYIPIVVERLPKRTQAIIDSIIYLMSFGLFMLAALYCGKLATDLWQAGELSPTLRFPYYPLVYGISLGCLLLSLVLLVNVLKSLAQVVKK